MIKSEEQLVFLMERVSIGRGGAALVGAQLGTPIPVSYVQFIGFLVKVHNIGVALLSGLVLSHLIREKKWLFCFTEAVRVFFPTLMYNAILLINEEIMNPFSGDISDFPMKKFDETMRG